jgi:1-acyl-sn-glycerol-3-phosphate acyltransferase
MRKLLQSLLSNVRGILVLSIYALNTIILSIPIYLMALLKLVIPFHPFRRFCDAILIGCANTWVGVNNLTHRLFCNIRWHVQGLESLQGKDWYLIVSNHQSWVDIPVLQKVLYRRVPFLKFFLKQELFWVPVLGQAWWALDFPFMKRYTRSFLEKNPHLKGRDLEITRRACEKFKTIPVSVMNFLEGTRFTKAKHEKQQSPFKHLLKPRAGGIAFALSAMGEYLNSFIDVTIAYPEGAKSFWDYVCGNIRDIRVQIRSLPITPEMLGDYFNDENFRLAFQEWVNALWEQKDRCIEELISVPLPEIASNPIPIPQFPELRPILESVMNREETSPA